MNQFSANLHNIVQHGADKLPEVLSTLVIGLILVEITIWVISEILGIARLPLGLKKVIKLLLRAFLFVILFIAVIQSLGLNNVFVAITGSSVVVALLISTGVAPLVTDVIAGVFLGGDREFQPGATVRAGDKSTEGVIQTMDLRKVYIRDKSGKDHVLPNSLVEKNEWVVLKKSAYSTQRRKRRIVKKSA